MPLPITNTIPPRELPPTGGQQSVCIGHYHIGTQETPYGDKEQIIYTFCLDEKRGDGKSFLISTNALTVSFDDRATLAKYIKGWLGRPVAIDESFDTASLVDQHVFLTISHGTSKKGNAFASIDGMSRLPKGMTPMTCEMNSVDYSPIDPSKPIPEEVPAWIAALIQKSREWVAFQSGEAPTKPASNGHAPAPPAVGLASPERRKLTMAEKGLIRALGMNPDAAFDDAALDSALEKARENSSAEEIAEAEATLRPLAIPF